LKNRIFLLKKQEARRVLTLFPTDWGFRKKEAAVEEGWSEVRNYSYGHGPSMPIDLFKMVSFFLFYIMDYWGKKINVRDRRRITSSFDAALFPPYCVARSVT